MLPASKVSVPPTVVMRTCVKVSDKLFPPLIDMNLESPVLEMLPWQTQVFEVTFVKTKAPLSTFDEDAMEPPSKPAVLFAVFTAELVLLVSALLA